MLPIHETIPLQILDPFTELFEVGHTVSARGSNAQASAWISEQYEGAPRYVMFLTEPLSAGVYTKTTSMRRRRAARIAATAM